LRPEKNGYVLLESKPVGGSWHPPGSQYPELWEPYKIWRCDLWKCEGCGIEIASGYAAQPLAYDYQTDRMKQYTPQIEATINDC
jgi:hypothetical protein